MTIDYATSISASQHNVTTLPQVMKNNHMFENDLSQQDYIAGMGAVSCFTQQAAEQPNERVQFGDVVQAIR